MRSTLPPAVALAIERCDQPTLVFDGARLQQNLASAAAAARGAGMTILFAAKSFAHPEVRALAAAELDGFDAGSVREVGELAAHDRHVLSVMDPSGRASGCADLAAWRGRLLVGCDTVDDVHAAPARAAIAIRVSASVTGNDPAIGAVLDGTGHRRSRFGVDVDRERRRTTLRAMIHAAGTRPVGLHVHHGPVTATAAARFIASARALLDAATDVDLAPAFLNLGGAWHGVADLRGAFAEVRAAVPPEIELIVEPGRAFVDGAGFACGRVVGARELDDRSLRVVDLSRSCHLRWSPIELVGTPPHPGTGRPTIVVGPTCFEEDVIGEWTIDERHLAHGARIVVRHVTGYAVGWNTSFGGVAPAAVVVT